MEEIQYFHRDHAHKVQVIGLPGIITEGRDFVKDQVAREFDCYADQPDEDIPDRKAEEESPKLNLLMESD